MTVAIQMGLKSSMLKTMEATTASEERPLNACQETCVLTGFCCRFLGLERTTT